MRDLVGKTVVITGGATGIGGAASRSFAEAGAKVLAQYHGGQAEAEELERSGILTLRLDLTTKEGPQALIDTALQRLGQVDVLVNNAGSLVARTLVENVEDDFIDAVFDLNCRQLVHCSRLAINHMKPRGQGNIINVTSIAARVGGSPGASIYAGAKGFVSSFSKSLAKEVVSHGIRVNCVSPGTIHTSFHDRFSTAEKREAARQTIPMQAAGAC